MNPKLNNKLCTRCTETKSVADFYKKGSAIDSHCKECKKAARKNQYVSKTNSNNYETTKSFLTAYFESEMQKLDQVYKQLEMLLQGKIQGAII